MEQYKRKETFKKTTLMQLKGEGSILNMENIPTHGVPKRYYGPVLLNEEQSIRTVFIIIL